MIQQPMTAVVDEDILDGTLKVHTDGTQVGVVNG